MLTLTAAGTVSDYEDTSAIVAKVAQLASVDESLVTVTIEAASVIITATIAVPVSRTAASVKASLTSSLGTAADASSQLNITIEADPAVVVRAPPPPGPATPPAVPPPAVESEEDSISSSDDGSLMTIIGGLLGGLVVVSIAVLVLVLCRRRARQAALESKNDFVTISLEKVYDSAGEGTEV